LIENIIYDSFLLRMAHNECNDLNGIFPRNGQKPLDEKEVRIITVRCHNHGTKREEGVNPPTKTTQQKKE
jgi:hypothetical protein